MKRTWGIVALLLLLGTSGVTSTYMQLSRTADEPWHVHCGMAWWNNKPVYIPQGVAGNPPLAQLMAAAPLFWANSIAPPGYLPPRDAYLREILLTRLGILPFYLFSCVLVVIWSRRLFGMTSALWSLAIYVSLSTVTGHAGLATTDMAYTAMFLWALLAGVRWLQRPGIVNALMLGESLGLMTGTKFSALVQWPAAMALIVVAQGIANHKQSLPFSPIRRRHIATGIIYVLPVLILMLGLLYHFSFDDLFDGIRSADRLNTHGFAIWMFGPLRHAVWYFFPVVFFFKTPLPFHFANIFGNWKIFSGIKRGEAVERIFPLLAAVAIMFISMTSNINLGVRHILAVYPLLSIPAGYGLAWLWQRRWQEKIIAAGLLSLQVMGFLFIYPDHLAYFNVLAGAHPEYISLDSDFDWGQDVAQLDAAVQERGIDEIHLCLRQLHVNDASARALLHAAILSCPEEPASGWIAVSRAERIAHPHKFAWLDDIQAVQTIGKTIDLYYIPSR